MIVKLLFNQSFYYLITVSENNEENTGRAKRGRISAKERAKVYISNPLTPNNF